MVTVEWPVAVGVRWGGEVCAARVCQGQVGWGPHKGGRAPGVCGKPGRSGRCF